MKRLLLTLLSLVLLLSACQSKVWEKDGVRARVVEPLAQPKGAVISWFSPADLDLKEEVSALVVGKITGTKEVEVVYTENGEEITYYRTILDIKITDAVFPGSLGTKQIKASVEHTTRSQISGLKKDAFSLGKEYLFALSESTDSPLKTLGLADYYMLNPIEFVLPTDADKEQTERVFAFYTSDKNTNALVESSKETAGKSLNGLKDFLREYHK